MAACELSFSINKEFQEDKVSRETAFPLISLFYVPIQKPASRATTNGAFIFLVKFAKFYYHKMFETNVAPVASI